jgi:DUF1680 family protein
MEPELPRAKVNGEAVQTEPLNGYARVKRIWKSGDVVEVQLPTETVRVQANPRVLADAGQVALQRGPFVYCIEDADFGASVLKVSLPVGAPLKEKDEPDLLGGVVSIESEGEFLSLPDEETTYFPVSQITRQRVPFRAIPYYAWDNRNLGAMRVWIPQTAGA